MHQIPTIALDVERGSSSSRRLALALAFALVGVFAGGSSQADSLLDGSESDAQLRATLSLEGDRARGRVAYEPCAGCHRPDGRGRADGGFPQLAGQHRSVIVKQLLDIRSGRRHNPLMFPYARRLSGGQEIVDVADYINSLPVPAGNGRGPGTDLALGESLYEQGCASCHGRAGQGDEARVIPALAGQHYDYMLRQIRDIGAARRRNMHPDMAELLRPYSDAQFQAIIDHVSRLEPAAVAATPPHERPHGSGAGGDAADRGASQEREGAGDSIGGGG